MLTRFWFIALIVSLLMGCSPPRGVYHTVKKGQTLYQIAKTYQVAPSRLASLNRISDPTRLSIGDRIFVPGATRVKRVVPTAIKVKTATKPTRLGTRTKATSSRPAVASKPKTSVRKPNRKPTVRSSSKPASAKKGMLQWPVKGKVVKPFRSKAKSATANGIEIAIRANSKIRSAAAGKIIYSGNGIPGYGNLIIIQHDNSLYSVYGFNRKNMVKAGSFVSAGQNIALSGTPPSGGVPRLYFEARQGKNPVNPIFYLP